MNDARKFAPCALCTRGAGRDAVDRAPRCHAAQEGVALIDSFFCSLDNSQSTDAGYQWP